MSISLTSVRRRRWLASLLTVAFVLRALIPAGFMPAGDGALALRVCPEGFPVALLAGLGHGSHHHLESSDQGHPGHSGDSSGAPAHDHKSWTSGHCAFGAAAGAPPLSHCSTVAALCHAERPHTVAAIVPRSLDFRFRIAQPRAPPTSLI